MLPKTLISKSALSSNKDFPLHLPYSPYSFSENKGIRERGGYNLSATKGAFKNKGFLGIYVK
jgi:hypothetical protein